MRRMNQRTRAASRGLSLLEAAISLAVFSIGMVGIIGMQLLASRSAAMARQLGQASQLAQDLVENVSLWSYDDPRLVPLDTIAFTTDPVIAARGADVRDALITNPANKPHYSEEATANALNPSALRSATVPYDGLSADVDGDGVDDFERYWNVFGLDADGDGVLEGKLVVVIVRWREPGVGFRRITQTTFRSNPGAFQL